MNIIIRKATIKDLKKVQELNLELFKKEYQEYDKLLNLKWTFGKKGTDYYKKRISKKDGCILVSEVDEKIVGYLCGGLTKGESYRNLPITAELENMTTLEEFRSKGIGSKLCAEFFKWCKENKVGKIKVSASAQNKSAIRFYKKKGFKEYALILERELK